ncbi:helix-turn-helix domain-containing protein [Anaeromyxobacter terrae]|uniref:helix-turn-helix domain-containing protein n=1 Tax=Anaeromyxobacter terrae TaxID=2925406 RepID=UPI001F5A07CE|nr:helix-turn-helix domain-containing protein [Anaeromyxobacter sp. SG22]
MNARKVAVAGLALTFREAAALLRIDRSSTLHELIRAGRLRPVPWGKGQRIPLEQIQELARTGFTVSGKPSRARSTPRRAPAAGVGARIRAIEVGS